MVLTARSSTDRGEKLAIVRSDLWGTMWRGMGDKSGFITHFLAYMISGSLRLDFPSIADGANKKSDPIHPFGHHRCIPRSPTGSVCSPSTRQNLPSLTPRLVVCKEFFQALQACHADNWRKWTGGCNDDKNELNMCLRKVVRLSLACSYVPVSLTDVGVATGGFGTEPGACKGTTKENRECVEGTAPRRLGRFASPHLECSCSYRRARRCQRPVLPASVTPLASLLRTVTLLFTAIQCNRLGLPRASTRCKIHRVFLTRHCSRSR